MSFTRQLRGARESEQGKASKDNRIVIDATSSLVGRKAFRFDKLLVDHCINLRVKIDTPAFFSA
jgi:hypothetical protein